MEPPTSGERLTNSDRPFVSIVMPAFNEEEVLPRALDAIARSMGRTVPYEVLVADHGSHDDTARIAGLLGARVESHSGGTIGSLRNRAAESARGEILAFLDADVLVTPQWAERLKHVAELLERNPRAITGSQCQISSDPSWLERTWFAPRKSHSHIGSGHLIIRRSFFLSLGGFDPALETGEDYDLSVRAELSGGQLIHDPELVVHHEGYPRTLRAFIKREAWHGRSDFRSLKAVAGSRVALLAVLFLTAHVFSVAAAVSGHPSYALGVFAFVVLLCVAAAMHKFGIRGPAFTAMATGLYYVYLWSRLLSITPLGGRVR